MVLVHLLRLPRAIVPYKPHFSIRNFATTLSRCKTVPPRRPQTPSQTSKVSAHMGQSERANILATKILEAGRDELYRNTYSTSFVATNLVIMLGCYCGIGVLYSTRLWEDEVAKERGLQWFVPKCYQTAMIAWGVMAAYAFSRSLGVVTSIKLVKNANKTFLETSVRRPIPFLRPEKLLSEPSSLVINQGKLYSAAAPEGMIVAPEGQSLVTRFTRAVFYTLFHNVRKSMGGVGFVPMQVGATGAQRHLRLDADGQFSNGGQDLLDISKDEAI